ncbi:ubiquinol oxidase subunit II [Roseateles sp.]|uniref:ubiquinol oxidase subunit II n=1 Tax=Roseateles sp. TaxID=1971397 RepID=UPI0039E7999A
MNAEKPLAHMRRLLLLAPLVLSACQPALLDPKGPVARAESQILVGSVAIMLAIVVPTMVAIFAVAFWFRASNTRANYVPDWAYSGRVELVVWSVPCMVVLLLAGVAWTGSHRLDPAAPVEMPGKPIEVQVVALDWKWLFIYPEQGIASVNQLKVPAGRPIHFKVTSATVFNAFFVPQLGSMIYAMSGMAAELNLAADQPGVYRGISSHFSGEGFSDMNFEVHAVAPEEFDAWAAQVKQQEGGRLDVSAYARLARPSINDAPRHFGWVEPKLFELVVAEHHPVAGQSSDWPSVTNKLLGSDLCLAN